MEILTKSLGSKFNHYLSEQAKLERSFCYINQKNNGIFLTNSSDIIDSVLKSLPNDKIIFEKTFLEPSCGQGIFLLKILLKAYSISPKAVVISNFIQNKIYFIDIDSDMLETTKNNIVELYFYLFDKNYIGRFNAFQSDFTLLDDLFTPKESQINTLLKKIDFVIGNPPYISLYGRRDKKKSEEQRIYYLSNYLQFPTSLKNGKINYVMLFIERGLTFLKNKGILTFVVDVSFFETAYVHCRKYLIENYTINSFAYNIQGFENVASGQIILEVSNSKPNNNLILVINKETGHKKYIKQSLWNQPEDEYKFRISHNNKADNIITKIFNKKDPTLKELYPKKNLRTSAMLLNMEDRFTSAKQILSVPSYPFYRGSNGLKYKYSKLKHEKYFNYDKKLQNNINNQLKEELTLKGIKNKKRIGFGEKIIYDNPKVYIRQSAKELIASYDDKLSSANNSLYLFSLRDCSNESILFLKYLCGLLNSTVYSFFAQERRIIRYNKGKQPQIKISDLYQIPIPQDLILMDNISTLVDKIYADAIHIEKYKAKINCLLYSYYELGNSEVDIINESIEAFLQ